MDEVLKFAAQRHSSPPDPWQGTDDDASRGRLIREITDNFPVFPVEVPHEDELAALRSKNMCERRG
jgi:hypothetical protein